MNQKKSCKRRRNIQKQIYKAAKRTAQRTQIAQQYRLCVCEWVCGCGCVGARAHAFWAVGVFSPLARVKAACAPRCLVGRNKDLWLITWCTHQSTAIQCPQREMVIEWSKKDRRIQRCDVKERKQKKKPRRFVIETGMESYRKEMKMTKSMKIIQRCRWVRNQKQKISMFLRLCCQRLKNIEAKGRKDLFLPSCFSSHSVCV